MINNKKGVILFIVLATILIVVILSGVILSIISSQARLTHHQVSRIKALYAGKGMMNYAMEMLRKGTAGGGWALPAAGSFSYACHRACDSGITPTYTIPTDNDIPYDVQIKIYPNGTGPNGIGAKLEIKTEYTYTP